MHASMHILTKRAAQPGYGLMLALIFAVTALILAQSLGMILSMPGNAFQQAHLQRVVDESVAESTFPVVEADILSELNLGNTVDTSYNLTGNITAPTDPAALGGATQNVGSYTATVEKARGNMYVVKVIATVGNATYTARRLMVLKGVPSFSCATDGATIEAAILAGNITSISDADLQAYASNNCTVSLRSPSPPTVAAPTAATGTTDCTSGTATWGGSTSPTNRRTVSGSCVVTANGTYSDLRVSTIDTSTVNLTYNGAQTIQVTSLVAALVDASTTATAKIFKFGTITGVRTIGGATDVPMSVSSTGCVGSSQSGSNVTFTYTACTTWQLSYNCGGGTSGSTSSNKTGSNTFADTCWVTITASNGSGSLTPAYTQGSPSSSGCVSHSISGDNITFTWSGCSSANVSYNCGGSSSSMSGSSNGSRTCSRTGDTFSLSAPNGSAGIDYSPGTKTPQEGTSGNDTFTTSGNCTDCRIRARNGNDIIAIDGTTQGDYLIEGDCDPSGGVSGCSSAGADKIFLRAIGAYSGLYGSVFSYDGNDEIYIDSITGGTVDAGSGDDILGCIGALGGSCAGFSTSATLKGGTGNDIIVIDSQNSSSTIQGNAGYNIIYVKGCNGGTINLTTGSKSLLIVNGNRSSCTISGSGSDNVILTPTASTGGTGTGFAKTLSY